MHKKKKTANEFERSALTYFSEIGDFMPLSKDEEMTLWEKYKKENDLSARDKIIKSNLKFVANVAKPFQNLGLSYSDLIAEGNLGLMRAIDKFDYSRGYKTISYSVWWIRQAILDALNNRNMLKGDEIPCSMEKDIDYDEEDAYNIDGRFVEPQEDMDDATTRFKEMRSSINVLMKCLTERERIILTDYFGLGNEDEKTLEEIGRKFGLTKERVRQIKEKSLKKLRAEALKNSITEDIYN